MRDASAHTDRLAIFFHPGTGLAGVSAELIKKIRRTVWERLGVSPDYVLPVERKSITKTSIGKIQRTQMAQRFRRGEFADVVRRVEVLLGGSNTLPDWFYRPVWRRAELRGQRQAGPVLVLADSLGLGEMVRQQVIAAGQDCVLVSIGAGFAEKGDCMTVDPGNAADYRRVTEALEGRSFAPASIVHLWTYGQAATGCTSLEELEKAQVTGLYSVLGLAQALIRQAAGATAATAPHLLVVGSRQGPPAFPHAPLLGLLKSIPREHPELRCRHVELESADHEANAALVLRELGAQSDDLEVAWRGAGRWARRMERAHLPAQPRNTLPLEKGGLYLLTGGLGGIGVEIARYLLRQFQARLILVGRTPLDEREGAAAERLEALQSLEKLSMSTGGGVVYAALDVAEGGALRAAVRAAEERWDSDLKGVFHLAGLYHECPLDEETAGSLAAALRPKLAGTWNLHRLLEAKPGALFVSFSSVNGFFGGHGVSAYAAANSFLESFSEYQRQCSGLKAYCVSWSLWDGLGMSRGHVVQEMARAGGFCVISPRQGMASLAAVLQRAPGHVLAGVDGSNPQMSRIAEGSPIAVQALVAAVRCEPGETSLLETAVRNLAIRDRFGVATHCRAAPAPAAVIDPAGRIDRDQLRRMLQGGREAAGEPAGAESELEKCIAAVWSEVLNLERLSVTDNFFDLGGGSLGMVQANRRLQERLNRRIAMTEMFPSIRRCGPWPHICRSRTRPRRRSWKAARYAARCAARKCRRRGGEAKKRIRNRQCRAATDISGAGPRTSWTWRSSACPAVFRVRRISTGSGATWPAEWSRFSRSGKGNCAPRG